MIQKSERVPLDVKKNYVLQQDGASQGSKNHKMRILISRAPDTKSRYWKINFRSETQKFYKHLFSELNSDY